MKRFLALLTAATALLAPATPALAAPLAEFGAEGTAAGEFLNPNGAAIEQQSGDLYIADRNNSRIDKFGPEGEFLLAFGWGVADGTSAVAQVCTSLCFAGLPGSGAGQFAVESISAAAVDNDPSSPSHGDVYVLDPANSRVDKFGPNGEFILSFGSAGAGPGEFQSLAGHAIAVDSGGSIYVADESRVQRFSPAGVFEAEITIAGAGFIENLAVDSTGDLYLTGSALSGVHKYSPTTPAGTELGLPRNPLGESTAIALDGSDRLLIADNAAEHIKRYTPAGEQNLSLFEARTEGGIGGIAFGDTIQRLYVLHATAVRLTSMPPTGPFVLPDSETATEIGPTSATLGALVNPEGPEATSFRFEYGQTTAYGQTAPNPPGELLGGGFEDQSVSAALPNLQPRTTYHYRVVAENAAHETSAGPDQTFETLPPVSIEALSASAVTGSGAILEAQLDPHGQLTEYHFEYGPTLAYGTSVPVPEAIIAAGATPPVIRSVTLTGLAPGTTYHYRLLAHNSLGSVESTDHTFTTQGAGSSLLPDGRVWELVSPPNKHGSPLEPITEEGGVIQAAADGSGFAYVAKGPVVAEPLGVRAPQNSQILAHRSPGGGWVNEEITTPREQIATYLAGQPSEYKLYSSDLLGSIVEPLGATPLSPQSTERTPYRRESDGSFSPLVTAANVPADVKFGGVENRANGAGQFDGGVTFSTATPDLSHVLLTSPQPLAAGFAPGFEPGPEALPNVFELSGGSLQLISILPNGEPASEAGLAASPGNERAAEARDILRGAISEDGDRVFFSAGATSLYLRSVSRGETLELDLPQPGAAGGPARASFQGASADGSIVFFKDSARLTADSSARPSEPDLYMCEIVVIAGHLACELTDLSLSLEPGRAANVVGEVSAIDPSGSRIFFAADGALTTGPNGRGETATRGDCLAPQAQESSCNLYTYDTVDHQLELVAVLSSVDAPDWNGHPFRGGQAGLTARVSPDGRFFAFMSARPLTGYDNRDALNGVRDQEVFLFDSRDGGISCVSCNPSGGRPRGVFSEETLPGLLVDQPHTWSDRWLAATIPGWTSIDLVHALYQSRYLDNSGRMFFNAADPLVPQDSNGLMDVYEYEPPGIGSCTAASPTFSNASGGCVALISAGTSNEESSFLDASGVGSRGEEGEDVFFLTASRLSRRDTDSALDVYDARIGGAEPEEVPSQNCTGEACQHASQPASELTPGSSTFTGPPNLKAKCRKGKVRKGAKCVKKRRRNHRATRPSSSPKRRASE